MLAHCSGLVCCYVKPDVEIYFLFEIDVPIEMRRHKSSPGK